MVAPVVGTVFNELVEAYDGPREGGLFLMSRGGLSGRGRKAAEDALEVTLTS